MFKKALLLCLAISLQSNASVAQIRVPGSRVYRPDVEEFLKADDYAEMMTLLSGGTISNAGVFTNVTGYFTAAGVGVRDSNDTHELYFKTSSNLTADRNLTFVTGDADRTITLSGNPTMGDWFDQAVKTGSTVTFNIATIGTLFGTNISVSNAGFQVADTNGSHSLIFNPASDLTNNRVLAFVTGDTNRTITLSGNPTLSDWFDQEVKSTSDPTFDDPTFDDAVADTVTVNASAIVNETGASTGDFRWESDTLSNGFVLDADANTSGRAGFGVPVAVYNPAVGYNLTNFEKLEVNWDSNFGYFRTVAGGTGTARDVLLQAAGSNLYLQIQGAAGSAIGLAPGTLYPFGVTGTLTLGSPSNRWAGVYTNQILGDKTITAAGTTGNQTINKSYGSVNFAAAGTSLTVTNSLVTANSIIICTVATNDTTLKSVQAVAGSGSFVMYASAAATAETRVNFIVIN